MNRWEDFMDGALTVTFHVAIVALLVALWATFGFGIVTVIKLLMTGSAW